MTHREREGRDTLRPGTILAGRYELRYVLGRGGSSVVYAARDEAGADVAVKLLDPEPEHRAIERARMLREARLTRSLRHPSIVSLRDAGELDDGRAFLVMERLRGRTIADRIRGAFWLPLEEVIPIAAQLLEALACAHGLGVVHRDVNPSNVFLLDGDEVRVKLIDFGIGRDLGNPESRVTQPDVVVGTLGYMAPEALLGDEPTERSDVYGAGATIYEMLTGNPPHAIRAGDVRSVLTAMLAPVEHVAEVRPAVPGPLAEGVMRALVGRPNDRWSSVRAMADACELLPLAA
ncbi:MAG: serine/threonine protein kinase [Sandaracinaceae bacterium]|nr:serine/threonine protein kinase [Sandaracinaceae bacterium]